MTRLRGLRAPGADTCFRQQRRRAPIDPDGERTQRSPSDYPRAEEVFDMAIEAEPRDCVDIRPARNLATAERRIEMGKDMRR